MVYLGSFEKEKIIYEYLNKNKVEKVYIFGENIILDFLNIKEVENIEFKNIQMYAYYYRLLQEISGNDLIVINNCLKNSNRYNLDYNCLRKYVLNTKHRIVFNDVPIIEKKEDILIFSDLIQDNPFLKDDYGNSDFSKININFNIEIQKNDLIIPEFEFEEYENEKLKIISEVKKNPEIIPNRLFKYSEKIKSKYDENKYDDIRKIQENMNILVSNFKIDVYFYNKLLKIIKEVENVKKDIYKCKCVNSFTK